MISSNQECLIMFINIFGTVMCVGEQNYDKT